MWEELAEAVVGPWGLAAVLIMGTQRGRKLLRGAFKESVKIGMIASEKIKTTYAEIQEEASDAIAEAHAERETEHSQHKKNVKTATTTAAAKHDKG